MFQGQQESHPDLYPYTAVPSYSVYPQQEPTFVTYVATTQRSYTHVSAGYPLQTPYEMYPPAVSQNGASLPDHASFPPAAHFLIETEVGSSMLPSYGNYSRESQPLEKDVEKTRRQSNVGNTFPCKLCKIVCNNNDALEKHTLGKKHQKNVHRQVVVGKSVPQSSQSIQKETVGAAVGETTPATSVVTCGQGLEKKKQTLLQNGVAAGSLLLCTMCDVACNDEVVFRSHLAGKKHASKVAKQATGRHLNKVGPSNTISAVPPSNNETLGEPAKKTQTTQPSHCEICKISCASDESLMMHKIGKRHLKNLSKTIGPLAPVAKLKELQNWIGPKENPETSKVDAVSAESMANVSQKHEPKNQEGTQNSQCIICEVCNIRCTSSDNLKDHLSGKKHQKTLVKSNKIIGPPAPITASTTTPINGPMENPGAYKGNNVKSRNAQKKMKRLLASGDDIETKRQKIVGGGAASDLVRVCTVCTVVCNSPTVFISHLAGQKHLAMEKQAVARLISQNA